MGLIVDELNVLADAFVYGVILLAVGDTIGKKKHVAMIAGYFQIMLALLGFIEVIRRFIGTELLPGFSTMIFVSFLTLIANSVCFYLLQKSKTGMKFT